MTSRALGALARGSGRRPLLVVLVATLLAAAGAGLAVGLRPTASAETFVGGGSASYRATQAYYRHFGQEPIEVLVRGSVKRLVLNAEELERLAGLEGCIAGKVPPKAWANEGGAGGPCARIARMKAVRYVIGPGTFVTAAAEELDARLQAGQRAVEREAAAAEAVAKQEARGHGRSTAEAEALGKKAHQVWIERYAEEIVALGLAYGLSGAPSIEDHAFVSKLVFGSGASTGTPKSKFAYVFPSADSALISVRLRSGVSASRAEAAIAQIRRAIAMPRWRLSAASYAITGEPAIVAELSGSITRSIVLLLVAAALVMALVLSLVFRGRPRLLPLALALLATAITFGGLALSGTPLSIGEVAVLPVLIGLAVDYAIQLHSRVSEALLGGRLSVSEATVAAAQAGGPAIAAAA
ncbi:MAG: MMPL family transporter, partial [Solirubrobacteraceae bacterium]